MAKRPPSSCTIGRSSGAITGTAARIIHSGLLPLRKERFDDFEALDRLDALLARRFLEFVAQVFLKLAQVQIAQQLADRFRAHAGFEAVAELLARFAILLLGEDLALVERRVARIGDDVGGEIDHLLELPRRHVEQDADAAAARP